LKLERTVLNRPEVIRAIVSNYVPLKVNVEQHADMARHFGVRQWPTDVIVAADGSELYRGTSPEDANKYIAQLDQVAAHARIGAPFSGSASTQTTRVPDAGAASRNSSFPLGGPTGFATQQGAERDFGLPGSPAPAVNAPSSDATQGITTPANHSGAGGESYVNNQFVTSPKSPALAASPEQQASYSSSGGQFQPHRGTPADAPQMTSNQFVPDHSGGLQAPVNVASAPRSDIPPAPQGPPTLALDGYCCVQLVDSEKWVKGDPKFGAVHRGRTYLFSSSEAQRKFLADFNKYAPALSGLDCVKYVEQGALVEGKRAHGVFLSGQIFLFADEAALQKFWNSPERYLPIVHAEQDRHAARH
jgi:protein disulfide-isomerase